MKEEMDSLLLINDFAKRSFRDVADQDYIAARMSYRAQLREPFLWSSLQAFEKYFKAILLFNRKSAKGVGHNINEGLKRVEGIHDLSFSIPNDVREFIGYINNRLLKVTPTIFNQINTNILNAYRQFAVRGLLSVDEWLWQSSGSSHPGPE